MQDLRQKELLEVNDTDKTAMKKLHFVSSMCRQPVAAELQSYIAQYCCTAVARLGIDSAAGNLPRASAYEAARYGNADLLL
jgi:hypothetical protein